MQEDFGKAASQDYANTNYKDNLWLKSLPDTRSGVHNGCVEPEPSSNLSPKFEQLFSSASMAMTPWTSA
jgi:hypothetical protein